MCSLVLKFPIKEGLYRRLIYMNIEGLRLLLYYKKVHAGLQLICVILIKIAKVQGIK